MWVNVAFLPLGKVTQGWPGPTPQWGQVSWSAVCHAIRFLRTWCDSTFSSASRSSAPQFSLVPWQVQSGGQRVTPFLLEVFLDVRKNAQVEDLENQLRLMLFEICHFQLLPTLSGRALEAHLGLGLSLPS